MIRGVSAKGAARTACAFIAIAIAIHVHPQTGSMQYHIVQAVVDSLRSPGQCAQIDLYLRAQPDVIVARVDHNTRNVMLQVPSFSTIDRQWLTDRFASLGLQVRCYRRYPLQSALYQPLDPRTCTEEVPVIER